MNIAVVGDMPKDALLLAGYLRQFQAGYGTSMQIQTFYSSIEFLETYDSQCAIHGYEVNAIDLMIKPVGYFNFSQKLEKETLQGLPFEECTVGCLIDLDMVQRIEKEHVYLRDIQLPPSPAGALWPPAAWGAGGLFPVCLRMVFPVGTGPLLSGADHDGILHRPVPYDDAGDPFLLRPDPH